MKDGCLYRGKELISNKWIVGYLYQDKDFTMITTGFDTWNSTAKLLTVKATKVDPETLGQCTGEKDKNGKLIFEGDKVKYNENFEIDGIFTVEWSDYSLRFVICNELMVFDDFTDMSGCEFEVVGNIHEEESA